MIVNTTAAVAIPLPSDNGLIISNSGSEGGLPAWRRRPGPSLHNDAEGKSERTCSAIVVVWEDDLKNGASRPAREMV